MDTVEIDRWQEGAVSTWRRRWGVPALRIFRRVGSTNDVARAMAEANAPEGTLVLADEQTRGRGRRGRPWSAPAGASLSLSMILRPPTPEASRILTLRLGLAAARALEHAVRLGAGHALQVELKWPNDLRLEGGKVGGILCEGTSVNDRVSHVIAGIGVNLRRPVGGWPLEIAERATSLAEAAPPGVDVARMVGHIVDQWRAVGRDPAESLSDIERSQFEARDVLRGREVTVDDRPVGVAEGVSADGGLLVRRGDEVRVIMAGTVRTLEPTAGETA